MGSHLKAYSCPSHRPRGTVPRRVVHALKNASRDSLTRIFFGTATYGRTKFWKLCNVDAPPNLLRGPLAPLKGQQLPYNISGVIVGSTTHTTVNIVVASVLSISVPETE